MLVPDAIISLCKTEDTDVGQRQGQQALHMAVWIQLWLPKWPNISRPSTFLGGNVRLRLAQPMNLRLI